jgi:hypothetical protein
MDGVDSTSGRPLIGDDTISEVLPQPADNPPRKGRTSKKDAQVEETLNIIEKDMADEEKEEKKPKSKEDVYLDGLKSVKLEVKKARRIQEQVLVDGYYEDDFKIGPVTVRLRTRHGKDTTRLHRALEAERPELPAVAQGIINRYGTAASLVMFGKRVFDHSDPENAEESVLDEEFYLRLRYVESRPDPVLQRLMQLSFEFDQVVNSVFAEGAPEDF